MNHFTDYDKIKAENTKLKQDIYNLIRRENEIDGMTTKSYWELCFKMEDMLWFGDSTIQEKNFKVDHNGRTSIEDINKKIKA